MRVFQLDCARTHIRSPLMIKRLKLNARCQKVFLKCTEIINILLLENAIYPREEWRLKIKLGIHKKVVCNQKFVTSAERQKYNNLAVSVTVLALHSHCLHLAHFFTYLLIYNFYFRAFLNTSIV